MAEKIGKAVITDDKGFYEADLPTGIHATTFRGPADGTPGTKRSLFTILCLIVDSMSRWSSRPPAHLVVEQTSGNPQLEKHPSQPLVLFAHLTSAQDENYLH
jgi:hypothetical protein